MKNNYNQFRMTARKALMSFAFLLGASPLIAQTTTKTTVFVDDFNRAELTPGGEPETNYVMSFTDGATAPFVDAGSRLKMPNKTSMQGEAALVGSLSEYSLPFAAKLSEVDEDSLVWTLNVRQNYNSRLTGFSRDADQNGLAIMLVADNASLTVANGYAIINAGDASGPGDKKYSLAKVTGGLVDNANVEWLITGLDVGNSNRDYMSIKVVFIPKTSTWKMYQRNDGGTFANPLEETPEYNFLGTEVDDTFTSTEMTHFGFTINYKSMSSSLQLLVDHYQVDSYKTDLGVGIEKTNSDAAYKLVSLANGVKVEANNANVKLFNLTGQKLVEKDFDGSTQITSLAKGVYILKIQVDAKTYSAKVMVK